jgi:hypothetical protein
MGNDFRSAEFAACEDAWRQPAGRRRYKTATSWWLSSRYAKLLTCEWVNGPLAQRLEQ